MKRPSELELETIDVRQEGRVLTARYSSPPLNFATAAFIRDLDTLTAAVDHDATVGAVVLTGGVPGRFLTHADLTELGKIAQLSLPALPVRAMRPIWKITRTLLRAPGALRATEAAGGQLANALAWGYRWRRTILRMNRSNTVYIAAINGPTTGGGHEIALACDLRFVSDAPHIRVGQVESLVGLIPGGGGTQRLPKMVGTAQALEHMLEGAPLTAERAHTLGLVNGVVPDADLVPYAQRTAARLARRSPVVIGAIKELTYFATSQPLGTGLDIELVSFLTAALQPSMSAAVDAFTTDLNEQHDSPLVTGTQSWLDGTRVDQTS